MLPDRDLRREAAPHEDDMPVQAIEIAFAIPVFLPEAARRELHDWISRIVQLKQNQIAGFAHWVSGYGSKPQWSQADARFLGKPVDPNAPDSGEPTFDDSVLHFETSCRELSERERVRREKGGA